jgi:cytidylate kinase
MWSKMDKKYVIAIDGPGASGKSTTAKALARKLKYIYIDTGAMYRACALCSLESNIDLEDIPKLIAMLSKIDIRILYSEKGNKIFLNGKNISQRIREADITKRSSEIAKIGIVREKMVELQIEIGKDGGVIMDGRDIGTVVFPNADFKFFMIADEKTRALRRWKEAAEKGENLSLKDIEKELIWRDANDSSRKISPLKQAEDAIPVDTSSMTIDDQVEFLFEIIKRGKSA